MKRYLKQGTEERRPPMKMGQRWREHLFKDSVSTAEQADEPAGRRPHRHAVHEQYTRTIVPHFHKLLQHESHVDAGDCKWILPLRALSLRFFQQPPEQHRLILILPKSPYIIWLLHPIQRSK